MSPFFLNSAAVLFLFIILTQQGASQLTLTPSSSTACPGDEVNLVCHHPLVASNAQTMRYLITTPAWRENGSGITPAPGTRYQATIAADLTSTTLTFTISSEQFNEGSFYYNCFLVLAGGGLETSENATVEVSGACQLTLTPSSSTACPGDVVNLVCYHPEVASNAQTMRYLTPTPAWRENGSGIIAASGSRYQTTTTVDLMSTTLTITILSEHFNESSYYYNCFLVLAGEGLETSGNATVVILELSSPVLTSTTSLESSITVEWVAVNCARSYNVSWQCVEPNSTGSISTTSSMITIPVDGSTECTLSLVAVSGDGSTGPVTTTVVHPGYPRPTADPSASTSQDLILTCQFGEGEFTDIQWTSSQGPVDSSDNQLTLNYTTLQRGTEYWCSGVPMGRAYRVIGLSYIYNGVTCPPVVCPPTAPPSTGIALIAGSSIGGVLVAIIIFIAGGVSGVLAQVLYRKVTTEKSAAPPSSPPAPSYGHTQGDVGAGPEMTDNPSYQLVERSQDSKQLYQNV